MAVIVAMIANSKGKSPTSWLLYGLVIWPIALVHILISEKADNDFNSRIYEEEQNVNSEYVCELCKRGKEEKDWCAYCCQETENIPKKKSEERECPFCAELIKAKAIKCKHCGSKVEAIHKNLTIDDA